MAEEKQYKSIFKSTFLFSFVQVVRILVSVVKNKVVAILLGAEGMGIMGIFQNTLNFIKTGSGLGISQSAVKDISEANASDDLFKLSHSISVVRKVVLLTSFIGFAITVVLAPMLSRWGFGDYTYTFSFVFLGVAVFFEVFVENQLAILKGMRQLRSLAKASIWGALAGLLTGVPLYFWLGVKGIIPSFVITAFSIYLVTRYYVDKISYKKENISHIQALKESKPMITMGVALMLVSLIGTFFDLFIAAYIRSGGGLSDVGYYQAGITIVTSYIGVIITAMSTDYYPRICAINQDNIRLAEEVNQQSEVGLVMVYPLAILFVFLSPLFIKILYSQQFLTTINYTDFAIIGSVITICSNSMGMILLAKQASKLFLWSVIGQRTVCIIAYLLLYSHLGILGLGLAYIFMGVLHIVTMSAIMKINYHIKFKIQVLIQLSLVVATILLARYIRGFDNIYLRYFAGGLVVLGSCFYSYTYMKRNMGIDIIKSLKSRINNKLS